MAQSAEERIGELVTAIYETISGPAGPRDWARLREIFHPRGTLMRTVVDSTGAPALSIMSVDGFVESTTPFVAKVAFYEVEIDRRVDIFENMAHVWSVYETRDAPADPAPDRRGVNSIQLSRDATGAWQIVSMIWDNQRPADVPPEVTFSGFTAHS